MLRTPIFPLLLVFASVAVAGDGPFQSDWESARERAKKDQRPLMCVTLAPG